MAGVGMFDDFGVSTAHTEPLTLPASCTTLGGIADRREILPDQPQPVCYDPTCEIAGGAGCKDSNAGNGFVESESEDNWGFANCCLKGVRQHYEKCSVALQPPCECDVSSAECISAPAS